MDLLTDLGFADITPPPEKSDLEKSLDESNETLRQLFVGQIEPSDAANKVRQRRAKEGLKPIVLKSKRT